MTGAAGALGAQLVRAILTSTETTVIALVRAPDDARALTRARVALQRVCPDADLARLQAVAGDVSLPMLGLSHTTWQSLRAQLDATYHCAAQVNMALPYPALRAANVTGTQQVARLAAGACPLHVASTLSVFVSTDRDTGTLREDDDLSQTREVYGGYAQSKWAAERWLLTRAPGEVDAWHHRLGLLTGDSQTARSAGPDFLGMFWRGLAAVGATPPWDGDLLRVDITPIDHAARAMLALSQQPDAPRAWHITAHSGATLTQLTQAARDAGARLDAVSWSQWWTRLRHARGPDAAALAIALCRIGEPPEGFTRWRTMDLFQATEVDWGDDTTRARLAAAGVVAPRIDESLLARYAAHALRGDR